MIAILEYGAGNQTSVSRALSALGIENIITSSPAEIDASDGLIFPGVGASFQAMSVLRSTGMDILLKNMINKKKPMLGICLGSQIMLELSEEGPTKTLGIFKGKCKRFQDGLHDEAGKPVKIPHMGWNKLNKKMDSVLLKNIPQNSHFYFVHSYYIEPPSDLVIATSFHGHEFCAIYGVPGLWGAQFHPEKSGRPGLKLLENFSSWCREHAC